MYETCVGQLCTYQCLQFPLLVKIVREESFAVCDIEPFLSALVKATLCTESRHACKSVRECTRTTSYMLIHTVLRHTKGSLTYILRCCSPEPADKPLPLKTTSLLQFLAKDSRLS